VVRPITPSTPKSFVHLCYSFHSPICLAASLSLVLFVRQSIYLVSCVCSFYPDPETCLKQTKHFSELQPEDDQELTLSEVSWASETVLFCFVVIANQF